MKKGSFIFLLTILSLQVFTQERIFQVWNLNKFEFGVSEKTTVGVSEKIHYLPQSGNISLKFGDVSVKHFIKNWFEIGATGRLLWSRSNNGWILEQRPMVFGNLTACLGRIEFDFSNRFEYRMYKTIHDHFRHKQMFSIELPPFQVPWFTVYVAEEGYVRFDKEDLHLARLHTGTRIRYHKNLEMKVYYAMEKSKKTAYWRTSDIFGLNLNFGF